jgi:hypothetical protein
MMLLAVQYAVQPRLSKKYISPQLNTQSVALVEEVVKTSFAAAIFFSKPTVTVQNALKGALRCVAFVFRFWNTCLLVNILYFIR